MRTSVLKFGGSSFTDNAAYHFVAEYAAKRVRNGEKLAIVVSAMSGTTGRLKEAAKSVNPNYSNEAGDMLLATGEMVSMCLLRIACEMQNLRVGSLTGFQLGLTTDDEFGRARVLGKDVSVVTRLVNANDVTIICGGQAITADNRLTMLGRNSSDLTAILVANMLGLDQCEIFSDVPGIYSTDPYWVPTAQCIPEVSYTSAIMMSKMGAKVLHFGCVVTAQQLDVRIHCRRVLNVDTAETGTIIGKTGLAESVVIAKNACFTRPNSDVNRQELQEYFSSSNLNYIPIGSDYYLLDDSITGREIAYLRTKADIQHGFLVTLTKADTVTEQRFIREDNEARSIAESFHQKVHLPHRHTNRTRDLVKNRSAISDVLTTAM